MPSAPALALGYELGAAALRLVLQTGGEFRDELGSVLDRELEIHSILVRLLPPLLLELDGRLRPRLARTGGQRLGDLGGVLRKVGLVQLRQIGHFAERSDDRAKRSTSSRDSSIAARFSPFGRSTKASTVSFAVAHASFRSSAAA